MDSKFVKPNLNAIVLKMRTALAEEYNHQKAIALESGVNPNLNINSQ